MLRPICCRQCELLVKGRYLVLGPNVAIVRLVRYSDSSSFPISLRALHYCPFCGKSIGEGLDKGNTKHDCLPFKAASTPEKGHFVCKLEGDLNRPILFNLVPDNENFPQGSLDYPETTNIGYCLHCGNGLT
jgi:hypothetical protein